MDTVYVSICAPPEKPREDTVEALRKLVLKAIRDGSGNADLEFSEGGAPFVAEHVARACLQVGSLADEIGGTLQKEFGGRRAFEEAPEGTKVQ